MSSKTTFTIGRDPTADIPVADGSVSRIHAEITLLDGDRIFVTDCQSSNGTYLIRGGTETRISQEKAGPGDQVKFGGVSLNVADVVAAVRRKMSAEAAPPGPPHRARGAGANKPKRFGTGVNLKRCLCGDIKSAGQPCPGCGQ